MYLQTMQWWIHQKKKKKKNLNVATLANARLISSNEPTDLTTMYWADLVLGRVDQTPTQSADVCKQWSAG